MSTLSSLGFFWALSIWEILPFCNFFITNANQKILFTIINKFTLYILTL